MMSRCDAGEPHLHGESDMRPRTIAGLFAILACGLTGCGTYVPEIKEVWDGPEGTKQIEFEIKNRIYCELGKAVRELNDEYTVRSRSGPGQPLQTTPLFPNEWGAQVSISLQIDEGSTLSPGVALNKVLPNVFTPFPSGTVMTPQSFSLGWGGTLSSTATRIDKFDYYWPVSDLISKPTKASTCHGVNDPFRMRGVEPASSSPFILSDLRIKEWLDGAMYTNRAIPSLGAASGAGAKKPDVISMEIKFVIVSSGNVSPTWKLVRVSANTGNSPLFAAGRTRTHDLIITVGPNDEAAKNSHFASQLGRAVNSGRSLPINQ